MAEENSEKTIKAEQDNQSDRFTLFDGQPEREQPSTVLDGQYALFEDPAEQQAFAATLVNDIAPDLPQPTGTATDKVGDFFSDFANAFESQVKNVDAERAEAHFKAQDQIQGNPPGTEAANFKDKQERLLQRISELRDFIQSPDFKRLENTFPDFEDWISAGSPQWSMADFLFFASNDLLKSLLPFVLDEVDELKKTPGMESLTLTEFMRKPDGNGESFQSLIERAISNAIECRELSKEEFSILEGLPKLKSVRLDKKVILNNALMNVLQNKPVINAGPFDLTVANATKKRPEVTVMVNVEYDENATGIKLSVPNMTEYERQVSDAVCALWLYGDENHVMTAEMIYRAMTGQGSNDEATNYKATSGQKSAITRFMRKWENIKVSLDLTDEIKMRGISITLNGQPLSKYKEKIRYLEYREILVEAGSNIVPAWEFTNPPIELEYSLATGQVLTVPLKIYDIKETTVDGKVLNKSVSNNEIRIAVKGNLLRRISIMKGKKHIKQKWSDIISFDTVFTETGLETMSRDKRSTIISYIRQCLDYWKALDYITDYNLKRKGKAITVVQIII